MATIKGAWTSIEQVPLLAWFRLKSNPKDVFPIEQINMQHIGGGFVPGAPPPKASPAVLINEQFWRPEELTSAFDVSLDGLTWQDCVGDVGGRGSLSDRLARLESALASGKSKLSDEVAAALKEQVEIATQHAGILSTYGQQIAELKEAFGRLADVVDSHSNGLERMMRPTTGPGEKLPAGNSAPAAQPGSEPPKDQAKSNPGAKPPERK